MIKKINRFLLLYFPLVWNTKALWMLLALTGFHIAFYISGWLNFSDFKMLQRFSSGYSTGNIADSNLAYAVIISVLLVIIWLVFYLRNNPFKSFYPLPRGYFAMEFCIIFLLLTGCIALPVSYARGFYDAIAHKTKEVDLTDEINTLNLAYALIPTDSYRYSSYMRCDSIEYRQTKHYRTMKRNEDSIESLRYHTWKDSLNKLGIDEDDPSVPQWPKKEKTEYRDFSYLNFCYTYSSNFPDSIMNSRELSGKLQLLLTSNNKAGVAAILDRFEKMCIKYSIDYDVKISSYTALAFYDKQHTPTAFIDDDAVSPGNRLHIDFSAMSKVLNQISMSRHRGFNGSLWLYSFFLALFMSLALYSFRLSSTRVWLISIVSAGVILIIYGITAALVKGNYFATVLAISLITIFYLMYQAMYRARKKTIAGVSLVLFTWSFPALLLLIHALIGEITRPIGRFDPITHTYLYPQSPAYWFLLNHRYTLMAIYLAVNFTVIITLLYRHYRAWQALDEE